MITHPERSGLEFKAEFEDEAHTPTVPTSVHWRLDCLTSGVALADWTEVTPSVVMDGTGTAIAGVYATIDIDGALNVIQDESNKREEKSLMVVSGKDTPREYSETFSYYIRNTGQR